MQTNCIRVRRRVTRRLTRIQSAPTCIKDFFDLPGDSGHSGLTLHMFPVVILVNQVLRYNCYQWKQL